MTSGCMESYVSAFGVSGGPFKVLFMCILVLLVVVLLLLLTGMSGLADNFQLHVLDI